MREYRNLGHTLKWGEDISQEDSCAMNRGEVFTLLNADGKPLCSVFKDSYGTIREGDHR